MFCMYTVYIQIVEKSKHRVLKPDGQQLCDTLRCAATTVVSPGRCTGRDGEMARWQCQEQEKSPERLGSVVVSGGRRTAVVNLIVIRIHTRT